MALPDRSNDYVVIEQPVVDDEAVYYTPWISSDGIKAVTLRFSAPHDAAHLVFEESLDKVTGIHSKTWANPVSVTADLEPVCPYFRFRIDRTGSDVSEPTTYQFCVRVTSRL